MDRDYFVFTALGLLVILFLVAIYALGGIVGRGAGYRNGYTQCLNDMKNGVSPKYKLVVQKNGESKWEEVKD